MAFLSPIPTSRRASLRGWTPQDIDYVEVLRGSYEAEYGDRTYGIFNILPKSGFDMNNEGRTRRHGWQFLSDR